MTSPSFPVKREPALAMHQACFGGQHLAADFGPGQAGGQANLVLLFGPEFAVLDDAQEFVHVFRRDFDLDLVLAFLDHAARDLAADVGDFALQIAHARFLRVVADDIAEASSVNCRFSSVRPLASRCFLTRKRLAISRFSISV